MDIKTLEEMAEAITEMDPAFKEWTRWNEIVPILSECIGNRKFLESLKSAGYVDQEGTPILNIPGKPIFRVLEIGYEIPMGEGLAHMVHKIYYVSNYGISEIIRKMGYPHTIQCKN